MIERQLKEKARQLFGQFPVLSITGPRQSGKTTLVKSIFSDLPYVTFEDIEIKSIAQNDPKSFMKIYTSGAIFDEVQKVPDIFSYIQVKVDEDPDAKYVLTGSQSFLLSGNVSQTLAGRIALLKLLPFSLKELNLAGISFEDYEDAIFKGFYPRIYDRNIDPQDFYPNYIQTYVERDIRQIRFITDLNDFVKFTKLCAGRTGQLLNISSIATDCGISYNTAKSWLSLLEASYVIFLLQPYYRNFNKRLVKMPKLYFYDTGLVCSLLGIEGRDQLDFHYLKGSLYENLVISEFYKSRLNKGSQPIFYFWRDNHGREIDLVIDKSDKIIPVEIKSGRTFTEDFFSNIKYWNGLSGNLPESSYVVYGGDMTYQASQAKVIGWKDLMHLVEEET